MATGCGCGCGCDPGCASFGSCCCGGTNGLSTLATTTEVGVGVRDALTSSAAALLMANTRLKASGLAFMAAERSMLALVPCNSSRVCFFS